MDRFEIRFARRRQELRTLFAQLYRGDDGAFDAFVDMLRRASAARPEFLRDLDRSREADPAWYKGHRITGMQLYVSAFAGTLRGVRERLDYIRACGVNYIHLMPLLQSPAGRSDGGYAVSDFRRVQPELGTMADLAELTAACHAEGISVCLDFVMNHTSEDHEWARRARAGSEEDQRRYFMYDSWDLPNAYEVTVPQVFPTTAPGNFTWCEEAGKVVMTTFYPYQWDLNYANPAVFTDMTDNLLFLCNQGVDIIRLDAVPYIWKALGTSCRNLPQVHTLVRMLRIACEVVCPGTLLLGEVVMEPSRVVPYFGTREQPECHMLYNVTTMATIWHTVATRDVRLLAHQLRQVFALPREDVFLNYLRCHDDIGWGLDYDFLRAFGQEETPHKRYLNDWFTGKWPGSLARGELYNDDPRLGDARLCGTTASLCGLDAALEMGDVRIQDRVLRQIITLHALMMSLSGIPVIYSGDEIAQRNDLTYHADPMKAEDSRWLHRGSLNWADAAERSRPGTPQERVFSGIQRLRALRTETRVFDTAADAWLIETGNDCVLAFGRALDGEVLICLYSFSGGEETVRLPEPLEGEELFSGSAFSGSDVVLEDYGFRWIWQRLEA